VVCDFAPIPVAAIHGAINQRHEKNEGTHEINNFYSELLPEKSPCVSECPYARPLIEMMLLLDFPVLMSAPPTNNRVCIRKSCHEVDQILQHPDNQPSGENSGAEIHQVQQRSALVLIE
jgi:hypothetical protein